MSTPTVSPLNPGSDPALLHQGLIYGSDEEFLAAVVPFFLDGLAQNDAVCAVTTPANIGLLRQEMGNAAKDVDFIEADQWYRAPGRTLGAYYRYVDQRTADGRHRQVRVIGEPVWHGRDALETAEWTRYEAAINLAFAACPAWIVCPYDTRVLPRDVVADARRTHPELVSGSSASASEVFAQPGGAGRGWHRELTPAPASATSGTVSTMRFGPDLSVLRTFLAHAAEPLGMSREAVARLVFVVNEVATNAVQHGGGQGQVALHRSGKRVVCDVTNSGGTDVDWYAGYLPPDATQHGHGLWTVRQLCELMEVDTHNGLTTVRLHLNLM